MLPQEGCLLRIFIGESDRHEGKLLYEWIVLEARQQGLAGATVLRGLMGFGAHSRLHTFKIERLSQDLPVIIEIIDSQENIEKFLGLIDRRIPEGLGTLDSASGLVVDEQDALEDPVLLHQVLARRDLFLLVLLVRRDARRWADAPRPSARAPRLSAGQRGRARTTRSPSRPHPAAASRLRRRPVRQRPDCP